MSAAAEWNRRGIERKRMGQLDEAAACYQSAIQVNPQFAEAHFNLGLLWRDLQRVDLAIDSLTKTVTLRPDVAAAHFELANVFLSADELSRAASHYEQALTLQPDFAAARFNLANLRLAQGKFREAETLYRRLLAESPRDADVLTALGTALQFEGRLTDAASMFQLATTVNPGHATAWANWGTVLKDQGQLDAAVECYQRAVSVDPGLVEAVSNLGNTLLELGQRGAAHDCFCRVADLKPADPMTYLQLGNSWKQQEQFRDAVESYQRALTLEPRCRDAWRNLGHLFLELGDTRQARTVCEEMAARFRDDPLVRLRIANCCPLVFHDYDEMNLYQSYFLEAAGELADAELELDFPRLPAHAPACPYQLQFLAGNLRGMKEAFARVYDRYFRRYQVPIKTAIPAHARPRIGFVVTSRHENAFLRLIAPLVQRLDPNQFERIVLCSRTGAPRIREAIPDNISIAEFAERFDHVVDAIRHARCDLLYYWEVGNDPVNYFLPFLHLAPVQITSWGIQITSGIPGLDAYLSSELVEVAEAQDHYTERLVLGSTLLTYQLVPESVPKAADRQRYGIRQDQRLYGCLQNPGKFHLDFDPVLKQLLERDPGGVIVTAQDRNGHAAAILRERWSKFMPEVADRIRMVPPLNHQEYLSLLAACDVLLDPIHFGGVTTTYDSLVTARPVVTLPTEYHRGRYTAACLRKIGVCETIAHDLDDYVELAAGIAEDSDRRHRLVCQLVEARGDAFHDHAAVCEHQRIFHELLATVR